MKKTILGCTFLIMATIFLVNNANILSVILYFIGLTFILWGAIPSNKES